MRLPLSSLLFLALGLALPSVRAARVEFGVQPALIEMGEGTTATLTIFGANGSPAPSLQVPDGLRIQGQTQNMQFGPDGSVISYNYVLVPSRPGDYTIGPFTYRAAGQSFDLPAVKLQVKPAGQGPRKTGEVKISDLLTLELAPSKPTVMVQEPFELTLSLYSNPRVNLTDDFALENMDITGLKFGQWQRLQTTRETRNGQIWNVRKFRAQARPLRSGEFSMRPGLQVQVVVPRQDPFGGAFDFGPFGAAFQETRPIQVTAATETKLVVTDPPAEGRPREYQGAVGSFQFHADITPSEVTAGDPVTLRVSISGRGNLDTIVAPEPAVDSRFKVYETKTIAQELNEAGTAGKKVFEKVLIPLTEEVDRVPEVSFSYFDPDTGSYRTAKAGPFQLKVKPGAAAPAAAPMVAAPSLTPGAQKKVLGEDIVYWKSAPAEWTQASALQRPALDRTGWAAQAVPAGALVAGWLWSRRRRRLETDIGYARRMQAPRHAQSGLQKARAAAKAGDPGAVHAALAQALCGYFANRLNVGVGEISPTLLRNRFSFTTAAAALAERAGRIFERDEAARFGGGTAAGTPAEWIEETETLLRECEKVKGGGS